MSILVQELECLEGSIGVLTLDSPGTLNALTEAMIDQMQEALEEWQKNSRICLVILQGSGDRGFCAGGNIRNLYDTLTGKGDRDAPARFFTKEYRLDYTLHRFPKPVVGIAHGIVMGGGLGLLSACRYRLITPDVTLAMPEIAIGLFPDVGASWFLNRLPGRLGLFMGLTGARLNASDALRVGLADMAVLPENRGRLLDQLQSQRWSGDIAADDNRLFRLLNQLDLTDYRALPQSELASHEQAIARLSSGDRLPDIVSRLCEADIDSQWWRSSIATLKKGSPVTAWLIWHQLRRAQQMSLKDIFRMELAMALHCMEQPDLVEGIRARLIDKDQSPRWSFQRVRDVPDEVVERYFIAEYSDATDPMALD